MLSVSCRDENEFGIRSMIMGSLSNTRLHLTNLQNSSDTDGSVKIEATIHVSGRRRDEDIEKLTATIALEKGVAKAGWKRVS